MSVAMRPKRLVLSPSSAPAVATSRPARHLEAPEWVEQRREAPESRASRPSEAPENGEGRASLLEHEFTHGRSQS